MNANAVRAVFFGTPAIAIPALRALTEVAEVVGVVCQPDRPAGRGLDVVQPPIKRAALELSLTVHQPERVKNGELANWLRERQPDIAVVLAYGRILPAGVLDAPRLGCVNLHASLLPKYRGAAPIQWAILAGEKTTGISLMQMELGLDTGPIFTTHSIPIGPDETAGELTLRIAELGGVVVRSDVPKLLAGELSATPQDAALASHAPPLEREHGRIDWNRPSSVLHDFVRGLTPRPGAFTTLRGKQLRITRSARITSPSLAPGVVRVERPRVLIGTADGALELLRAQVEGRRELDALSLVNGRAIGDGDVLGT